MRIYYLDTSTPENIQNLWKIYTSIKESDVVIIPNNNRNISQASALAIFYAMKLRLPIVLYNLPDFSPGIFPLLKYVILKRLNKLVVANINILDKEDVTTLLSSSKSVNYALTRQELTLGYSYTLSELRKTLANAQPSDLSPYPELTAPSPPLPLSS